MNAAHTSFGHRKFSNVLTIKGVEPRCRFIDKYMGSIASHHLDFQEVFEVFPALVMDIFGLSVKGEDWFHLVCSGPLSDRRRTQQLLVQSLAPTSSLIMTLVQADPKWCCPLPSRMLPAPTRRKLRSGQTTALPPLYRNIRHFLEPDSASVTLYSPVLALPVYAPSLLEVSVATWEYFIVSFLYAAVQWTEDFTSNRTLLSPSESYMEVLGHYMNFCFPESTTVVKYATSKSKRDVAASAPGYSWGGMFNLTPRRDRDSEAKPTGGATTSDATLYARQAALEAGMPQTFLHAVAEFWLGQNEPLGSPSFSPYAEYIPPTELVLKGTQAVLSHLLTSLEVLEPDGSIKPSKGGQPRVRPRLTVFTPRGAVGASLPRPAVLTPSLSVLQKPLYSFLRNAFWHLPFAYNTPVADVCAVWLRYLKPWECHAQAPPTTDASLLPGDHNQAFVSKWRPWIFANFLFYTTLLEAFLSYSMRLNFRHKRDVQLCFDVLSVFANENIRRLVETGEALLSSRPSAASESFRSTSHRPTAIFEEQTLKAAVGALEGSSFVYHSRTHPALTEVVHTLMRKMLQAGESSLAAKGMRSSRVDDVLAMRLELPTLLERIFPRTRAAVDRIGGTTTHPSPSEFDATPQLRPCQRASKPQRFRFLKYGVGNRLSRPAERPVLSWENEAAVQLALKAQDWLKLRHGLVVNLRPLASNQCLCAMLGFPIAAIALVVPMLMVLNLNLILVVLPLAAVMGLFYFMV